MKQSGFPIMDNPTVNRDALLSRLPPSPKIDHTELLRKLIRESGRKVIVVDDDRTGTQTVHDIPVVSCSFTHMPANAVPRTLLQAVSESSRQMEDLAKVPTLAMKPDVDGDMRK
jgi:hypothetical protein